MCHVLVNYQQNFISSKATKDRKNASAKYKISDIVLIYSDLHLFGVIVSTVSFQVHWYSFPNLFFSFSGAT